MKKLLFTLAALLSAGLFASAQIPEVAFSESEITLTPGGDVVTVKINLSKDAGQDIAGGQLQWGMYNAAHELMETGVTLEQTNIGNVFQPNWVTFAPGQLVSTLGVGVSETIKDGYFRVLLANMDGSPVLLSNMLELCEGAGIEPCMWVIKFKADADWADEFATFELVTTPEFGNTWVNPAQEVYEATQEMKLTIKNANWTPAEDLDLTG